VRQLAIASFIAAAACAAIDLPRSSWRGGLLIAALLYPVAFAFGLVALATQLLWSGLGRRARLAANLIVFVEISALLGCGGIYLTNLVVVDSPMGPWARRGYAVTLVITAVALILSRGLRDRLEHWIARAGLEAPLGLVCFIDAAAVAWLNDYGIRSEYHVHGGLLRLSLCGFAFGALLLVRSRKTRQLELVGAAFVLVTLVVLASADRGALYRTLAGAHGSHGQIMAAVRAWTDFDGDGYSAWFGGGDCDDADATAYPLSPKRDCLGWRQQRLPAPPALPAVQTSPASPRLIVFLTIDAFRCGFDVRDEGPLHQACPTLTRMAREGWSRLDAHTTVPNTAGSLTVLMTGNPKATEMPERRRTRPTLPQRLREAGYRTVAVQTLKQVLFDRAVREGFDEIDTGLACEPFAPFVGERLTERVLTHARTALADPQRHTFLWAHYPDPHSPFMVDDSPFKHTSIVAYADIVRRTDAAIGALMEGLSQLPGAADVLVFVTADHGEEFNEHGERYHGFTLYEPAMRIPFLAWSPVDHKRYFDAPPPGMSARFARYMLGAIDPSVRADVPDGPILLRTVMMDQQYGVIADGWKLTYNSARNTTQLFDLRADPDERHDVSQAMAQKTDDLGPLLGSLLATMSWREQQQLESRHARLRSPEESRDESRPR
jgi:hypothetical protein